MRLLCQEVAIVSSLSFMRHTDFFNVLIQVRQTISCWLGKSSEVVGVGTISEKISKVVSRPHSDIICAKESISVSIPFVPRL